MQLILEQHSLNYVGPLILKSFSIVSTAVLPSLRLVESVDAGPPIQKNRRYGASTISYGRIFNCVEIQHP